MRSIYTILILAPIFFTLNVFAKSTVYQARGLMKDHCYDEIAALSCKTECVLSLFPSTQAELNLAVGQISKKNRNAMGHIFRTKFHVLNLEGDKVEVLSLKHQSLETLKKRISSSSGLVFGRPCSI